jgi:FAD/FMN-containing dehydrogenase
VSGLREKARSLGGNLVVERIPDEVAPVVDSFGLDAASLTLMKRLKRGLDPDDRLAPGRMWRES